MVNHSAWGLAQLPENLVEQLPPNVRRLLGYYPSDAGAGGVGLGNAPGWGKRLRTLLQQAETKQETGIAK